jgi:hypothetical protein
METLSVHGAPSVQAVFAELRKLSLCNDSTNEVRLCYKLGR